MSLAEKLATIAQNTRLRKELTDFHNKKASLIRDLTNRAGEGYNTFCTTPYLISPALIDWLEAEGFNVTSFPGKNFDYYEITW